MEDILGEKKDRNKKLRMDLVPPEAIAGIARALTSGIKKGYADRDWEKGLIWGDLYGAIHRHLLLFWARMDLDDESHLYHLEHAICDLAMLLGCFSRGIGKDDRPHLTEKGKQQLRTAFGLDKDTGLHGD